MRKFKIKFNIDIPEKKQTYCYFDMQIHKWAIKKTTEKVKINIHDVVKYKLEIYKFFPEMNII